MAILKTVKLQWRGVEYAVDVTMLLISRIEEEVNLMRLALALRTGNPPMSHVAIVFAHLLRAGGCMIGEGKARRPVESTDVWNGMFQDGEDSAVEVIAAATAALQCVFPDVKIRALEGDESAKKKTSTRTGATRGKRSTGSP